MNQAKRKIFTQRKKHPLLKCWAVIHKSTSINDGPWFAVCYVKNSNPRSPHPWVYNGNKVGVTEARVPPVEDHLYEVEASAFECILLKDLGIF